MTSTKGLWLLFALCKRHDLGISFLSQSSLIDEDNNQLSIDLLIVTSRVPWLPPKVLCPSVHFIFCWSQLYDLLDANYLWFITWNIFNWDIDTNLMDSVVGDFSVVFVNLDNPPLHSVPIVDNWNLTTTLNMKWNKASPICFHFYLTSLKLQLSTIGKYQFSHEIDKKSS